MMVSVLYSCTAGPFWSLRRKFQKTGSVDRQSIPSELVVTPLTADLAQMTAITNTRWEERNKWYDSTKVFNTLIWNKEDDRWRIINMHRSFLFHNRIGQIPLPPMKEIYVTPDTFYIK